MGGVPETDAYYDAKKKCQPLVGPLCPKKKQSGSERFLTEKGCAHSQTKKKEKNERTLGFQIEYRLKRKTKKGLMGPPSFTLSLSRGGGSEGEKKCDMF